MSTDPLHGDSRRLVARLRWWLADRLRPRVWPSTHTQHGMLLDEIKEHYQGRLAAVEVLHDLAMEGRIDGLTPDGDNDLNDPTGSLARAAAILRAEAPDA